MEVTTHFEENAAERVVLEQERVKVEQVKRRRARSQKLVICLQHYSAWSSCCDWSGDAASSRNQWGLLCSSVAD